MGFAALAPPEGIGSLQSDFPLCRGEGITVHGSVRGLVPRGGDDRSTAETSNPSRGNRLLYSRVSSAIVAWAHSGAGPTWRQWQADRRGSQSLERESTPLKLTFLCRHRCA
jgi:hypothetical protein